MTHDMSFGVAIYFFCLFSRTDRHILRWQRTVIIHVSIKSVNYICILTSPKHTIRQCYVWALHKQLLRRVINQSSDYQAQVVAYTLTAGSPRHRGQFYAFMYKSMWCPLSKYWMVTLKVRQDHFAPVWQINVLTIVNKSLLCIDLTLKLFVH